MFSLCLMRTRSPIIEIHGANHTSYKNVCIITVRVAHNEATLALLDRNRINIHVPIAVYHIGGAKNSITPPAQATPFPPLPLR